MTSSADLDRLHWEDFRTDREFDLGAVTMTREDILDFARRWDPQGFHVDDSKASEISLDEIIASGWHTVCVSSRQLIVEVLARTANLPGPGIENIRWPNPVFPGDTLRIRFKVLSRRRSRSRPGVGLIIGRLSATNQEDIEVMHLTATSFVRLRTAAAGG